MGTAPAIEAFWTWWTDGGSTRCEAAIGGDGWGDLPDILDELIDAIAPGLAWEFGTCSLSRHTLCVSGAGDAGLRPTAERWLLAAPPSDETWEYRSARAPDLSVFAGGRTFEIGGRQLQPDDLRLAIWADEERHVLDVALWHPELRDADASLRQSATFLLIDWLLGEDAVERWIGRVELVDAEPHEALLPLEFARAVEDLERSHLEPTYALMSGTIDERPLIAIARRPLKRVEFPLFDLRMDARLVLRDPTPDGLPNPDHLEQLTAIEEDLSARLGDLGVLAAVVTHEGVRRFHVYCDQEGSGPAIGQAWTAAHPDETIILSFELDPAWEAVEPFC